MKSRIDRLEKAIPPNGDSDPTGKREHLSISAPNFKTAVFTIRGTAPYVQHAFSKKGREQMKSVQEAGSTGKKGKKRDPKNFQECYEQARHCSKEGWYGIPASGLRRAMIDAYRTVGFKMTHAKMSVFVLADGFDKDDGTPLIKFTKGEPHYTEHIVRLSTGVADVRARAMWDEGWEAEVRVQFDADQFTTEDVANLLARVGIQVGLGEGRPFSKESTGMGWGTFMILDKESK